MVRQNTVVTRLYQVLVDVKAAGGPDEAMVLILQAEQERLETDAAVKEQAPKILEALDRYLRLIKQGNGFCGGKGGVCEGSG